MEINFDKYNLRRAVYEGQPTESVDIPLGIIIDELLKAYRSHVGIDTECFVVKMSDYKEKIQKPSTDYYVVDVEKILKVNVDYAVVQEWWESTPHGSIIRIDYGGESDEQHYRAERALNRIQEILDN